MTIKVAFQMDHIGSIDIHGDSSFRLALEAQSRGYELFYYLPTDLYYREGDVIAEGHSLQVSKDSTNYYGLGQKREINLRDLDVVWLRQDPPFDMSYITTTHLLEQIMDDTLVVNNPFWVRNFPEKLIVLNFPDIIPATLITRNISEVRKFRDNHGDVIIKPLFGNGGAGIFKIATNDGNLNSLCEMFFQSSREPIIVQEYLPAISEGDKRVILVDGKPVGAINRIPQKGETRSNLHVGGTANPCKLTENDYLICSRIENVLSENGLIFTGIDIIGNKLTEINMTSPTGMVELERFDGVNVAGLIWDSILDKIQPQN
ncbi:MAG: glutathione synthase [Paracoccaceae bacterium]|nr:glutathione synthase [Paracoccaceae bacterium]